MPTSSRTKVMNNTSLKTSGGLKRSGLKYNKQGRIVSVKKTKVVKPIKGKLKKNEFYCVKCQKRRSVHRDNIEETSVKVGYRTQDAVIANCNSCGIEMWKFIKM